MQICENFEAGAVLGEYAQGVESFPYGHGASPYKPAKCPRLVSCQAVQPIVTEFRANLSGG
jgi:hypothetical protein